MIHSNYRSTFSLVITISHLRKLNISISLWDNNDSLLKEMDHWPTYYPASLDKDDIKEEMLAH